ncbi:MAG: cyclic nucleotide-binding domain-containing protein [Alphaproteobacteria bacterium]|nr:cyclic nucleotide-binding domain-containing protein [Alphaproteobacteria bacterium]
MATPLVRASAMKKLSALLGMSEPEFHHFFQLVDLPEEVWTSVMGLEVMPVPSPHPVECACLRFRAMDGDGYRIYAHMADIVSHKVLQGMVTDDENAPGLSRDAFDRVWESYLVPADVKKLDVGGGLIHGAAADFREDPSDKIVLAHRATPLTTEERRIGAGAPFGTSAAMILGSQTYTYQKAARLLRSYFPDISRYDLQALLNGPVQQFNPEAFLCREGEVCDHALLLLTGQAERLESETSGASHGLMAAGAIIAENCCLHGKPLEQTYRALSFVTALRIPAVPLRHITSGTQCMTALHDKAGTISFMRRTGLFNDNLSRHQLLELLIGAETVALTDGRMVEWGAEGSLDLVVDGTVELVLDGEVQERAGPGGFFGETFVLNGVTPLYEVRAAGPVELLRLRTRRIGETPVVRWKLLECNQTRLHAMVIQKFPADGNVAWSDAFRIHVPDLDQQHRGLFVKAGKVYEALAGDGSPGAAEAIDDLLAASRGHFAFEEALLRKTGYEEVDGHAVLHRKLIADMEDMARRICAREKVNPQEFRSFFLSWLAFHILGEDRKFVPVVTTSR